MADSDAMDRSFFQGLAKDLIETGDATGMYLNALRHKIDPQAPARLLERLYHSHAAGFVLTPQETLVFKETFGLHPSGTTRRDAMIAGVSLATGLGLTEYADRMGMGENLWGMGKTSLGHLGLVAFFAAGAETVNALRHAITDYGKSRQEATLRKEMLDNVKAKFDRLLTGMTEKLAQGNEHGRIRRA